MPLVEPKPLRQRQVAEHRVLDKQVAPARGQELALEPEEPREALVKLALDGGPLGPPGVRRRRRIGGRSRRDSKSTASYLRFRARAWRLSLSLERIAAARCQSTS